MPAGLNEFILALTEKDVSKRISIQQALQHPFLTQKEEENPQLFNDV